MLLRNQNDALPLSSSAKVVVTGPAADSVADTLGGWSVGWQGVPDGSAETAVTVWQGLHAAGGANVHVRGHPGRRRRGAGEVADAVVVVLGRGPGRRAPTISVTRPCLPTSRHSSTRCKPPASR